VIWDRDRGMLEGFRDTVAAIVVFGAEMGAKAAII
jgi:hypothetical protein